jgi:hypothetical protein
VKGVGTNRAGQTRWTTVRRLLIGVELWLARYPGDTDLVATGHRPDRRRVCTLSRLIRKRVRPAQVPDGSVPFRYRATSAAA